jgi:hypothetical protein
VEDELFHVDEQKDVAKLEVTFRNFAKAPKNIPLISVTTCLNAMFQLLKMTGFCEHGQIYIRRKGSLGDILDRYGPNLNSPNILVLESNSKNRQNLVSLFRDKTNGGTRQRKRYNPPIIC